MDAGRIVCISMRKVIDKLESLCSLSRLYVVSWRDAGETASSTRDQGRASSTESQTADPGIFDGTWQDGSEHAAQFRHDETVPDSLASAVEDKNAPRRRQASTSTSIRIFLKFRVCGWSENTWDPALADMPMDSGAKYRCHGPVRRFGKHICLHSGRCAVEHACDWSYSLVHFGTRREQNTEVILSVCLR